MEAEQTRKAYRNLGGNSAVRYFAIGDTFIRVWFKDGSSYLYDHFRAGRIHVEAMKRLAEQGKGLGSYINHNVSKSYTRKYA